MQTFIGIHPRYLPHVPKEWEWMHDKGKESVMKGKNEWQREGMCDEQKKCMTKGRNGWQTTRMSMWEAYIYWSFWDCIRLGKYKINHTRSTTYKCIKQWLQSPKKLAKAPRHVHFETLERTDKKKAKDPTHYIPHFACLLHFYSYP